jgi:hypothetical protein
VSASTLSFWTIPDRSIMNSSEVFCGGSR